MKRILITGTGSYVGKNVAQWLARYPDNFEVEAISLRDGSWRSRDFHIYDYIFHVAGIAHVSLNPQMEESYYKVNRDLTLEIAQKAKSAGVQGFIFMSSIIVYGEFQSGLINRDIKPVPSNFYGNSKLQAEEALRTIETSSFKISIIRAPMIYGRGCNGNYNKLRWMALNIPIFPDIENRRSMIHIDNLCELVRLIIENSTSGLFFPQNSEYVKTSRMVQLIAEAHGKKVRFTKTFNPVLKVFRKKVRLLRRVFGDLAYDQEISSCSMDYRVQSFKESIKATESEE